MFERFTERARQVVVYAQDEARPLGHEYIGTEHLLLGLLREERGFGGRVLQSLGVDIDETRAQVVRIVGRGEGSTVGQIPFTPHAKRVLELSLREAAALGHEFIDTEHILLGLVREGEGVGSRVLEDFGVDVESVRQAVVHMVFGPSAFATTWNETRGTLSPVPPLETAPAPAPTPVSQSEPTLLRGILIGWALCSVTLGAGLLLGWLIWG